MAQHASPHTSTDSRSLTDLYRDLNVAEEAWRDTDYRPGKGKAYFEAQAKFTQRLGQVASDYWAPPAEICRHGSLEHPEPSWDAQATVFTTGRFADGWAR